MTDQLPIEVVVKLEFWETYRALTIFSYRMYRKLILIFLTIGTLFVSLAVFAYLDGARGKDWQVLLENSRPLLPVAFILPTILLVLAPLLGAMRVQKNPILAAGTRYKFSDTEIHIESKIAVADVKWEAFTGVLETKTLYLLWISNQTTYILAKRVLTGPGQSDCLRELFRSKIPSAKLFSA